jgi:hypothetical protein
MPSLVNVEPLFNHRLRLQYADGVTGIVDLSHWVNKGVFHLWNDPAAFERVSNGESGEVRWSDKVALCGDALYLNITGEQPEDIFTNLAKATSRA